MVASLVFDDERGRLIDRLIAELSSGLCAIDGEHVDGLINSMLARIGNAVHADATTLVVDDGTGSEAQTYQWTHPDGADEPVAAEAEPPSFWSRLRLDGEPLVLERIPEDLPASARTVEVLERLRRRRIQSAVVAPV